MKSDDSPALKISNRIKNDPLLKDTQISVSIGDYDVIVHGQVNKFFKKALICSLVSDVTGLKNIVDQMQVVLTHPQSDDDILDAVSKKFEINFGNSYNKITIKVNDGQVVLGGNVKWAYQKLLATECISYIEGIVSIENHIAVASKSEPEIRERDILAAIYKDENIITNITIDVTGRKVTLTGNVASSAQKQGIEKIVLGISGVHEIDNKIEIVKNT